MAKIRNKNGKLLAEFKAKMEAAKNAARHENVKAAVRSCMDAFIQNGLLVRRSEIKKYDTIDASRYAEGNCENNTAALPYLTMTKEESELKDRSWYSIIPPLTKGVLKLNKDRYLQFEISDLNLEEQSYTVEISDYGFEAGIWMLNWGINAVIKYNDGKILLGTSGASFEELCELGLKGKLSGAEFDVQTISALKNGALRAMKVAGDNDYYDVTNHFLLAMVKINKELLENRPKAARKSATAKETAVTVKSVAGELEKEPKKQVIRTLKSGITFKSVDVPKAPCRETIRKYKVAAWNTRGHVRHLKSGKEVYVRPSIHKRKCFADSSQQIPQTIILSTTLKWRAVS